MKLHRRLLEWEWVGDPVVLSVFIQCMLRANLIPKRWQGIDIPAGSFLTSRDTLAKECGVSEKQVRRALDVLERADTISRCRAGSGQLVSLHKWAEYQEEATIKGRQRASGRAGSGPFEGRSRAATEEGEKERREPNGSLVVDESAGSSDLFGTDRVSIMRKSDVGTWEAFKLAPKMIEAEKLGIDVRYYFEALLGWSDTKHRIHRTAQGWVSTVANGMLRDEAKGKLKKVNAVSTNDALAAYFKIAGGQ